MSGLAVKIKKLRIQNFKSIEDLSIGLNDGLNILIGDNGAGKSNFLEFVDAVIYDIGSMQYAPVTPKKQHSKILSYQVDIEYKKRGDLYLFQLCSSSQKIKTGKSEVDNRRVLEYSKFKNGENIYKNVKVIWAESKIDMAELDDLITEIRNLYFDYYIGFIGFNMPTQIDYISAPGKLTIHNEVREVSENDTDWYPSSLMEFFSIEVEEELQDLQVQKIHQDQIKDIVFKSFDNLKRGNKYSSLLKKYTPIKDVRLNENINIYNAGSNSIVDNIILNFKVNGAWLPWSFLSDGTKRLFHIVTEIVLGDRSMILIEEPELGIHPDQLHLLMDFLKNESEKKQVLVSSHSPIVLDILDADELDNIIITKLTSRGTKMHHLNDVQLRKANAYIKKVGKLSDYWLHSDLEK